MKVLVLMSTYNGDKYLHLQIDSILSQQGVDVYLLIRDDGSHDDTCNILEQYAKRCDNVKWIRGVNIGFVKSFSELVRNAQDFSDEIDYFAFSDQDDVWLPNKLKIACERLSLMNNEIPILFSSNSICCDDNINPICSFHEKEPFRTRENVMLYPTEQGCSMVFNKFAICYYNMHPPLKTWHDRWMLFICNFIGDVTYCHTPLFYYRIHGGNVNGKMISGFGRIKSVLKKYINPNNSNYWDVFEFYDVFKDQINSTRRNSLEIYIGYKDHFKNKLLLLNQKFQKSHSFWNRLRKFVLIMSNRL